MTWPTRTRLRLASVPIILAAGIGTASAKGEKSDTVDIKKVAASVELDSKLARCTVSKERKGRGLEGLLTALKDGKPPVIARAIHRWKQQRIAGETRKTPKFVFGSKTGSDKDAKIAIMSDEYDAVSWGPNFDENGGKRLYKKLGKAVDCKCDDPIDGKLDPMLTGLRESLEVTGRDDLREWGENFTSHDLAAVAQQVIATQEPQEGEIAEGVKLEVGLQTYATRQLFGYMHPVYDPDANALSCQKLEDSLPVSTEFQLYLALTGIQEKDEAELAEANIDPNEAQGDADLIEEEEDVLADGEVDEETDVAALDPDATEEEEVASIDEEETFEEGEEILAEEGEEAIEGEEVVDVDEPTTSKPKFRKANRVASRSKPRRKKTYYEEPVHVVDEEPVYVVEDVEDDVDDWYDYPGYYNDYDVVEVYVEPPPPVIIVRPPVITPVVAILGGAIVFAAVTRPRWKRPLWRRPRPLLARNNVNINVNFFRPRRARGFKPGWGLKQNRGFVRRKPKNFARGRNRIIPAAARLRNLKRKNALRGKAGLFKAKRRKNALLPGGKNRKGLKGPGREGFGGKNRKGLGGKLNAKRRAALAKRKAALAKKNALLNGKKGGKKGALARKNAAKRAALAKKRAALAKKRKGLLNGKKGGKKAALAKQKALKAKRKRAQKQAALAKRKAAQKAKQARKNGAKKAAAAKKRAQQKAAAARKKAAAQKAAIAKKRKAAKNSAAKRAAAKKAAARKNAAKRAAAKKNAARKNAAKRKAAAARANKARKAKAQKSAARKRAQQAKRQRAKAQAAARNRARAQKANRARAQKANRARAKQAARKRAQQANRARAQQAARRRAQQAARRRAQGAKRRCPPGKRFIPGKGCR
ncbi:MAG: hypothetical protein K0U74_14815 [Alphaproteobacteria bacterium]|nr:hypothetical protein [Alphaproteobacteria bacterium]